MNRQDLPQGAGGGSNPPSTASQIQSMEDIAMEDMNTVMDTGNHISIASLTVECHQLFREILDNIQQSDEFDIVETQFGRLNIWASNIGAVTNGNSSLDYRLRLSDDIKSMVLQLLEVLKGSLRQAIDGGRDSTRWAQIFGEVIEAASASLDRLQNLAIVIKKSSARSRNLRSKALSSDDEVNFKDFILKVLKHRFKEANGSLCEQVAESIALRRKQFDYKIRHQRKLACGTTDLGPFNSPPEPSMTGTKHRLAVPQTDHGEMDIDTRKPKRDRYIAPHGGPCAVVPSETNASTLDTKVFRETLPGHKTPRSIVSQGTSVRDLDQEYPPPPASALEQKECTCPYCCEILLSAQAKNERWWKHHVDTDLEPYSCISEKCRSSLTQFAKFQDWIHHMDTHGPSNIAWGVHLEMFRCPICEALEPFRWKEEFMDHMNSHHAERFTQAQLLTLSRRSTVVRKPHICPFCNCMPEDIAKITPQNRGKITELLPRHIASHVRSLAFMALPYRDDINDYKSEPSRDQFGEESSARSCKISDITDLEVEWSKLFAKFEGMEFMEPGDLGSPYQDDTTKVPFSHSPPRLEWAFLPLEEYHIQEDAVMQRFIATQEEMKQQNPTEATNVQGGEIGNTLQAASLKGHYNIVKLLLAKGADVNAQGGGFGSALQAASVNGHESVIELLLGKGVDVNAQGGYYGNALQAASVQGHENIVKLLLAKGADVNAQGGCYGNALQAASLKGRYGIVELLLGKGADVNAQGGEFDNALQAASLKGHENIVKLLLAKGADVNAQGGYYGNALYAASYSGHDGIVKLLLAKGADVNAQGGHYGNALQAASVKGHENIVKLLLAKGADVNAQGGYYGNALYAASVEGHENIVKLLLAKGADVNAQVGYYGNALQAASVQGHESIIELLLGKGADVNAQGGGFGNALQAASVQGHESIIELLLGKGADVNAQGGEFDNALQAASVQGYKNIVKLLLAKGADVNAQGGYYGNALQAASVKGHYGVVELLLSKGAAMTTF
ncbi:uncharacterized protein DFL_007943 [Arthrobotrys flagrans]|uniref:Uncharacterized protein n=1 Tax=Arthrobotrys flagrans TaxID=97331 RepID=A0A436ZXD2_ARTFL|nr:hypothetical protein DFL_007943 [Arthrobotrys flagrans]